MAYWVDEGINPLKMLATRTKPNPISLVFCCSVIPYFSLCPPALFHYIPEKLHVNKETLYL
jgi:hypothetical protein